MKKPSLRKNLIISIIAAVAILVIGTLFALIKTKKMTFKSSADTSSVLINLSPASGNYNVGDKLTFDVVLDNPTGAVMEGFNLSAVFDPALMANGQIDQGDINSGNTDFYADNGISQEEGQINIAADFKNTDEGGNYIGFNGGGKIATITFDVIAGGNGTIQFGAGSTVPEHYTGNNLLTEIPSGGSYTLVGSEPSKPTVNVSADPLAIINGNSSKITWSITDAAVEQCIATPDGWWARNLSGSVDVKPQQTTTYNLTCENAAGSTSSNTQITVTQPEQPAVSVVADPVSIDQGGTTKLTWATANLDQTQCVETPIGWFDKTKSTGYTILSPEETTAFTLVCGNITSTATVEVVIPAGSAPDVTFEANGQKSAITVGYNSSVTLSWATAHAKSCTASGGWSGSKSTSGTYKTANLTTTTTYTLTCKNDDGKKAKSVTVNVGAQVSTPTPTPSQTIARTSTPIARTTTGPKVSPTPKITNLVPAMTSTPIAWLPNNILPTVAPIQHNNQNTQQIYQGGVIRGWTMWIFYAVIPLTLTAGVVYYFIRRKQKRAFDIDPGHNESKDIWKNPQF